MPPDEPNTLLGPSRQTYETAEDALTECIARLGVHYRKREDAGQRLYVLLALFDRRDGSVQADLVQAAREGWERSHPDMAEGNAWEDFDRLWSRWKETERDA